MCPWIIGLLVIAVLFTVLVVMSRCLICPYDNLKAKRVAEYINQNGMPSYEDYRQHFKGDNTEFFDVSGVAHKKPHPILAEDVGPALK
jgi:hypothetical protein